MKRLTSKVKTHGQRRGCNCRNEDLGADPPASHTLSFRLRVLKRLVQFVVIFGRGGPPQLPDDNVASEASPVSRKGTFHDACARSCEGQRPQTRPLLHLRRACLFEWLTLFLDESSQLSQASSNGRGTSSPCLVHRNGEHRQISRRSRF